MDEEIDTSPDVACDACTGRKRKAEESCLQSMASYSVDHLDMHNVLHLNAKRHKLVGATERFEEPLCPENDKLMELKLRSIQKDINERIKTRQRETKELKQATEAFQTSARQAVEENENSFTELIHSIETRQREVKELILAREKAAVEKAKELLERLPLEIRDLKRRDCKLQQLERLFWADNGVHFLQRILSTPALTSSLPSPVLFVRPHSSFDLASEAVLDLVNRLRHVCNLHFTAISEHVKAAKILTSPPVFTKRDDLMQSASKLTLNLDTAHVSLHLSQNNTQVTAVQQSQHYPEHQDRFDSRAQILCKESLRGAPHYWEVEYGGSNWVCIAVSYKGINRKGKLGRLFGRNRCSWGLRCYSTTYEFWHANKYVPVTHSKHCSRIGVYLDQGVGILEFYNVLDDMSLIYKAQIGFTEPVYAGFGLGGKKTHIRLCNLERDEALSGK
ncbi:tripartite motif-containing protein 16-like isoform X1 [Silurus asotus]|uniref:Tripartite motif-containing protein 16-like isoform X1 n=1 Tax=Silurus asotus TaxID=30991 RepID=A0AAD5ABC1_SILAS|nr:tripartite motif-containing protein 16-like isoform X1 [Silurus asotus]